MKADTLPLHRIFDGERRFVAPLYQRPYVWERSPQLETFWDHVREIAERLLAGETVSPQFLGAIVLDQVRHQTDWGRSCVLRSSDLREAPLGVRRQRPLLCVRHLRFSVDQRNEELRHS